MYKEADKLLREKLYSKEISLDDYYKRLSFYTEDSKEFNHLFEETLLQKDAKYLEDVISIGCKNNLFYEIHISIFNDLLIQDWHTQQEEIASWLCIFPNVTSVEFLNICARTNWKHLEYNNGCALKGKYLFVLRAINSKGSIDILNQMSTSEDETLRVEAIYQLSKLKK